MKNILTYIASCIVSALLATMLHGCGGNEGFEITLDVAGQGNRGIGMAIVSPTGVSETELHPRDGKVKASGSSEEPVLVEFFDLAGGEPIVSLVAMNGDRISVKADPSAGRRALEVKGSEANGRFVGWLVANDSILTHSPDREVNDSVAAYITAHRNDIASTLMMVACYRASDNPARADSLFNLLTPDARPRSLATTFSASLASQVSASTREPLRGFTAYVGRDTLVRFSPSGQSYALFVFQAGHKPDSVVKRLRALRRDATDRVDILELSFSRDSATWRSEIKGDTARWRQAWLPGGPAAQAVRKLNVPTTPFYIVIDSLGYQAYRGRSLANADSVVRARMAVKASSSSEPADTANAVQETPVLPRPEAPTRPGMLKIKPVG